MIGCACGGASWQVARSGCVHASNAIGTDGVVSWQAKTSSSSGCLEDRSGWIDLELEREHAFASPPVLIELFSVASHRPLLASDALQVALVGEGPRHRLRARGSACHGRLSSPSSSPGTLRNRRATPANSARGSSHRCPKPPHFSPAERGKMVEAAGIEPASQNASN